MVRWTKSKTIAGHVCGGAHLVVDGGAETCRSPPFTQQVRDLLLAESTRRHCRPRCTDMVRHGALRGVPSVVQLARNRTGRLGEDTHQAGQASRRQAAGRECLTD